MVELTETHDFSMWPNKSLLIHVITKNPSPVELYIYICF